MKRYWFRRKTYGFGWVPARPQGWIVLGLYVLLLVLVCKRIGAVQHSLSEVLLAFIPEAAFLSFLLLVVCYFTGEPLKWQWGKPEAEE